MAFKKDKINTQEILAELETRFLDGERLTTEQIITQYTNPASLEELFFIRRQVHVWINSLKHRFKFEHQPSEWFGVINDNGEFGLPDSEAEYFYIITKYANRLRGNMTRAFQVYHQGINRKVIQPGKTLSLNIPMAAGMIEGKVKNEDKD